MPTGCRVSSIFADYCDKDTFKEIFPLAYLLLTLQAFILTSYSMCKAFGEIVLNSISLEVLNILKQTSYVLDLIIL
jgi:hypothetical protein